MPPNVDDIDTLIQLARREDLGPGDITTSLLDDVNRTAEFRLAAKEPCVFAGRDVARRVVEAYDTSIAITWTAIATDGAAIVDPPQSLATIRGPIGSILAAERVLLNFLSRISGVATLTRAYVDAVAGAGAAIYDTRKTVPGWRTLDKYAVRCGGGKNHRAGLFDAVLVKDNHLAGVLPSRVAATVFDMLSRLPPNAKPVFVEVEADTLDQVEQLLKVVGIDVILLDNFSRDDLVAAVSLRRDLGLEGRVTFEASGGITLDTVRDVAWTGVERISVGTLTHSTAGVDLSLERI